MMSPVENHTKNELADIIAKLCFDHYKKLPKKGKPQQGKEWTLLAAIVKEVKAEGGPSFEVVSMGTGTKCLGQNKLSKKGDLINDSHAEIIARRAFLKYLLYKIGEFHKTSTSEIYHCDPETFCLSVKSGVEFHFFTSHTPCGDASIFPKENDDGRCLSGQKRRGNDESNKNLSKKFKTNHSKDALRNNMTTSDTSKTDDDCTQVLVPSFQTKSENSFDNSDISGFDLKEQVATTDVHRTGAKCVSSGEQDLLLGGAEYHKTGLLRTKPGRGERTLSMCCSDKIAKWNILGCQGSLLSHLLEPVYFKSFVVGSCPYNEAAITRALVARVSTVNNLHTPYKKNNPIILQSSLEFEHNKRRIESMVEKAVPSNSSIIWSGIPGDKPEVAVNGKKQGITAKNLHKPEARCSICKTELFINFHKIVEEMPLDTLPNTLSSPSLKTYRSYKESATNYQSAWKQLLTVFKDWVRAPPDLEEFTLEDL